MSETLLRVENLSKKYSTHFKDALRYAMQDLGTELIGRSRHHKNLRPGEFWAVKDLSFELKRGECLGLIGPNGAGKSTLLKILNGLIRPDRGRVEIRGRVGALIELGAGFNPLLTGRENVYINGSILGFSKREIDRKFDAIVEFSEIGNFINSPVQSYSSGMKVRLGFAVAAQMEPDVFFLDEILAVGDAGFRAKCFNAMIEILKRSAVIFVSHLMPQIGRICTDVLVMDQGRPIHQGKNVAEGIQCYYSKFKVEKSVVAGNGKAVIHALEFQNADRQSTGQIRYLEDLYIDATVKFHPSVESVYLSFTFLNLEQQVVAACHSQFNGTKILNAGQPLRMTVKFPRVNLNPGVYTLTVSVSDELSQEVLAQHHAVKQLRVTGDFVGWAPVQWMGEWNVTPLESGRPVLEKGEKIGSASE